VTNKFIRESGVGRSGRGEVKDEVTDTEKRMVVALAKYSVFIYKTKNKKQKTKNKKQKTKNKKSCIYCFLLKTSI